MEIATRGRARVKKKGRRLIGAMLVAIAISASAASPAYASGSDAATAALCDVTYYFSSSYYSNNCG